MGWIYLGDWPGLDGWMSGQTRCGFLGRLVSG